MTNLDDRTALQQAVRSAVAETTVTDIHTHLFPPAHGDLLLWGPDELLTYHYLVAELFTVAPRELTPQKFWAMPKTARADLVWEHVFLRHGALSEAARGAITTLGALGLDVAGRDLAAMRAQFAGRTAGEYLDRVFELADVDYAVMTNNPFEAAEVECWNKGLPVPARLKTALRIDTLLLNWSQAARAMSEAGYTVADEVDSAGLTEARRFLGGWISRISPMYLAASLPETFRYPADDDTTKILDQAVLPVAIEHGLPLAMMIGVKRGMNPPLADAGDGVGIADVGAVAGLCGKYPAAKFIATMLSRVNQHELCVTARKFGNLHVEGCWWFCNTPSIIEETTRMRLELLGTAFTCQHSDARVLDQLIYKWSHTRKIVADVLADKYGELFDAGWRPTDDEIRRDVRAIFGGSFEAFLAK